MTISEAFLRDVANALYAIIGEGRFADSVIQRKFRENRHWEQEERTFFAELLYSMLRNWRRIWYALNEEAEPEIPRIMRAVAAWMLMNNIKLQRLSFTLPTADVLRSRWNGAEAVRALQYSLPEWLDKLGEKELGEERWSAVAAALHQEPQVSLRVNTLKATLPEVHKALEAQGVPTHTSELSTDALILSEHRNVFASEEFKKGWFEVQDVGSQCIAPFCQVQPGMRVVDACAGSGGKSLHLAALMKNKGRILALDTEEWKLNDLSKRAVRAGASIIETRFLHSTKVVKRLHDSADRVLLDVPCSGLGVLRRNPDAKWHLAADDINTFIATQRDILRRYSLMTSAQGKLIYATCSILPAEGEEQVRWFITQFPQWQIEEERRLHPDREGCDGFYMARLCRISN